MKNEEELSPERIHSKFFIRTSNFELRTSPVKRERRPKAAFWIGARRASVRERSFQRLLNQLLGLRLRNALDDGHFRDQQVLGAVVHLLLAEGEALLLLHFVEVLEHLGDVFRSEEHTSELQS